MIDELEENERAVLRDLQFYGTFKESRDPDGSARVVRRRSYPLNLVPRLCDRAEHEGWEFWAIDGRLTCGQCHPPAARESARWLVRGGPLARVDLGTDPAGGTKVGVYTPPEEPENDERAPQRRRRRHEAQAGQGSFLSSPQREPS